MITQELHRDLTWMNSEDIHFEVTSELYAEVYSEINKIRHYLTTFLPSYMLPSQLIKAKIPITPNGKLERNILEAIEI